jgi:hypothetical protein
MRMRCQINRGRIRSASEQDPFGIRSDSVWLHPLSG